ncbi:MAG: DUF6702 family protein, partial [Bacteroidota bacterium]
MIKTAIIIFSILYHASHPFHISVTDIEYDEEVKSIEIAQKIFISDFEEALVAYSQSKINLLDKSKKVANDDLIRSYLAEKLNIEINGKPVELEFLGSQIEPDAIWCFLEVSKVRKIFDQSHALDFAVFFNMHKVHLIIKQ